MFEMIGHIVSSLLRGEIWREALKSLLYFIILLVVSFFPVRLGLDYFYGNLVESRFGDTFHLSILFCSVIFSALFSYLVLMLFRDSYFYRLVRSELGGETHDSNKFISQLKSLSRVVFLLVVTILGFTVSFFMPILGFFLLSFCFAIEVLSYVFDEARVGLFSSVKFVFRNFLATLVLGAFCFLSSVIPGLGLVTYPVSIRAAALFFKQKEIKKGVS